MHLAAGERGVVETDSIDAGSPHACSHRLRRNRVRAAAVEAAIAIHRRPCRQRWSNCRIFMTQIGTAMHAVH
jgi:hypothetical protein